MPRDARDKCSRTLAGTASEDENKESTNARRASPPRALESKALHYARRTASWLTGVHVERSPLRTLQPGGCGVVEGTERLQTTHRSGK